MILVVGASGMLGGVVARRLLADGDSIRVLSRSAERVKPLAQAGADVMIGNLRDSASLTRACVGVDAIFYAAHGLLGMGGESPQTIDALGVASLSKIARDVGVAHFVMTSIHDARPDHPHELYRAKYAGEQALKTSGLSYTILRPTAIMELWLTILATPIVQKHQALIFGRGENPMNYISVDDLARYALLGLRDPHARGATIEAGGPENLSQVQIVELIERLRGEHVKKQHIPLPALRVLSVIARPVNPSFARRAGLSAYADTHDMTFDPTPTLARFPGELRTIADVARERVSVAPAASNTVAMT